MYNALSGKAGMWKKRFQTSAQRLAKAAARLAYVTRDQPRTGDDLKRPCRFGDSSHEALTINPQLNAAHPANMFAARQRAACVARQLQRTARTYASDAHAHHKPAAPVNESFGVRMARKTSHTCSPRYAIPQLPESHCRVEY